MCSTNRSLAVSDTEYAINQPTLLILHGVSSREKSLWVIDNKLSHNCLNFEWYRSMFAIPGEVNSRGKLTQKYLGVPNESTAFRQFFNNLLYKMANRMQIVVDLGDYMMTDECEILKTLADCFGYHLGIKSFDVPCDYYENQPLDFGYWKEKTQGQLEDELKQFFTRYGNFSRRCIPSSHIQDYFETRTIKKDEEVVIVSPINSNFSLVDELPKDKKVVFLGNYFLGNEEGGAKKFLDYITNREGRGNEYFLAGPDEHYLKTYLTSKVMRDKGYGWIANQLSSMIPDFVKAMFDKEFKDLPEPEKYLRGLNRYLQPIILFESEEQDIQLFITPLGTSADPTNYIRDFHGKPINITNIGSPAYESVTNPDDLDINWQKDTEDNSNEFKFSVHSGNDYVTHGLDKELTRSLNLQSPDIDSVRVFETTLEDLKTTTKKCKIVGK